MSVISEMARPHPAEHGSFERTVECLLDAAFDDAAWGDAFIAMDAFCGLMGGQLTALEVEASGELSPTFGACYIKGDPREEIVADWVQNYSNHSENVPRIGRLPLGQLTHNEKLFTAAEKRTSLMYNEFQPKYDCQDQVAVVISRSVVAGAQTGFLMWTMRNGMHDWSPDRLNRIRALLPHIRQSVRLRQELVTAETETYATVPSVLESTALGIVLVDRHGRIALTNDVARGLLQVGSGIYDERGTIRATSPVDNARLTRLVDAALPRVDAAATGGSLSVRRSGRMPLVVHVHPISPRRMDFGVERIAAMLVVRDPDLVRFDAEAVGRVLGLTPAESRVAVLLAGGMSVREIARHLHRSENTVRWTLNNAFAKTGGHSQTDLVRLVFQIDARLPLP